MARFNNWFDNLKVASPCSADWDQMIGNERARFCGQCNLNVYNLSSMTKAEAELLITGTEGRLCVRYFKRADGSVLTSDCPVGLRAFQRKMSCVARAVSSAVLSFLVGVGVYQITRAAPPSIMGAPTFQPPVLPVVEPVEFSEELVLGQMKISQSTPKPRDVKRLVKTLKNRTLVRSSKL